MPHDLTFRFTHPAFRGFQAIQRQTGITQKPFRGFQIGR
jgi:hypothetical protein